MKKLIIIIIILLTSTSNIFLLKPRPNPDNNQNPTPEIPEEPTPPLDPLENILNNMTIDEKIGQLFIVAYRYPNMDSNLDNILKTIKPGGFILFKENLKNYNQSMVLINSIKKTAKIPMFIATDQEGGRVQRIKDIPGISTTNIPAMAEIGATNDPNEAYKTGVTIANDLKKFSVNLDFAPVIDIYSNPLNKVIGERSFGSDAYLVSKMGLALGQGLKDNNIIPVYKHFPGHGNTKTDSHYDLPIVSKTKEELMNLDLIPFMEAINNNAEIIMVGHLAVPSITNNYEPASLSKILITDFLKKELGYQNLIITDALNMKALTNTYSTEEITIKALNAGVDILLMPEDPLKSFAAIKNAFNSGTISEKQINDSVRKIINLKLKYQLSDFYRSFNPRHLRDRDSA